MFSSEIKSVHFTGVGGTAMASAAAAMLDKGFIVTGSDQNIYEPMASFLAAKKITVMNGYDERNLSHHPDLVVIGNAISRGNPEAEFVLDHKRRCWRNFSSAANARSSSPARTVRRRQPRC
jgi:UDP-N-acetylmuramate: L-alanyl-gamma-D-glutamyl-meso-diaminopimelate ligase